MGQGQDPRSGLGLQMGTVEEFPFRRMVDRCPVHGGSLTEGAFEDAAPQGFEGHPGGRLEPGFEGELANGCLERRPGRELVDRGGLEDGPVLPVGAEEAFVAGDLLVQLPVEEDDLAPFVGCKRAIGHVGFAAPGEDPT